MIEREVLEDFVRLSKIIEERDNEIKTLKEALHEVCDGYVRPETYGTPDYDEMMEYGSLENYFIEQAKEE